MRTTHFKLLICSGDSFKAMRHAMAELSYEARMERGFVLTKDDPSRVEGKYYFIQTKKLKGIDRKTLKPIEEKHESLQVVAFTLDLKHGLVSVQGPRGGLNALFEALDAMPDVGVEFQDLKLNVKDYVFELQHAFNKNEIKNLRIKGYLFRENMVADVTGKLLDVRDGEKLAEKFAEQLEAARIVFKLPSGKCGLNINKRGTLSIADDAPTELFTYATEQLPRFHEADIETVEVRDPNAKQGKKAA